MASFPYSCPGDMKFAGSNLRVLSQTYGQGIAEGDIPNHTKWKVIGFRTALSTAESHLALGATGRFPWPAVAQKFYIVSTDADDAAGDTGARSITFAGIKGDGTIGTEEVALAGATVVETVGTYLAPVIDDTCVETVGATGWNEGTITCGTANPPTATTTAWAMTIGTNQAAGSVFLVPTGKRAYLMKILTGEASTQGATIRLYATNPGMTSLRRDIYLLKSNTVVDEFLIPPSYAAGTRLEVTGQSVSGSAIVSCKFLGWLENA